MGSRQLESLIQNPFPPFLTCLLPCRGCKAHDSFLAAGRGQEAQFSPMTYKEKSVGVCEKAFAFLKTWTDAAACPSSSQLPLPPVPPTPTCIRGCDSPGPGGQQVHGLRVEGREKLPGALVALLSRHSSSEQPACREPVLRDK